MLPPFRIVERLRPVRIVQAPETHLQTWPADTTDDDPIDWSAPSPAVAPYVAVEIGLDPSPRATSDLEVGWTSSGGTRLTGWLDLERHRVGLEVASPTAAARRLVSRRFGRLGARPARLALSITGTVVTLLVADTETSPWLARARYDVPRALLDLHEESVPAGLSLSLRAPARAGVRWLRAGSFGQLGLRDLHTVTTADGDVVRHHGRVLIAATSAGPGFFPTAHTSVWAFDPAQPGERAGEALTHLSDLYFRRAPTPAARARSVRSPRRGARPGARSGPGVYGDHGTQVIRDDAGWRVLTSSWGDFAHQGVRILTATTTADLTSGCHVLDADPLPLPTTDVGAWDPHLMRVDHEWVLAYVAATRFFDHHPVLARGPAPDRLRLVAADLHRHATEGVVLVRPTPQAEPVLLASDGRQGSRRTSGVDREPAGPGFPVFDLALRERGRLQAPYPTNLPWPNVWREGSGWLMATFDGTRAAGPLTGYGTHGDVVVMRSE